MSFVDRRNIFDEYYSVLKEINFRKNISNMEYECSNKYLSPYVRCLFLEIYSGCYQNLNIFLRKYLKLLFRNHFNHTRYPFCASHCNLQVNINNCIQRMLQIYKLVDYR